MSNLNRYAIVGSRRFNNYYILQNYLNKFVPKDAILISGHSPGTDQLVEVYAQINNIVIEVYKCDWNIFGKDAPLRQRRDIVRNSDKCIAFWDGISPGTKSVIDMFKSAGKTVNIIDITDNDIITQSPLVGHVNHDPFDVYIGKDSEYDNPFVSSKYTKTISLALYTNYILTNPDVINKILTLENKKLGCWCHHESLCHGDVIEWLLKHEKRILLNLVNNTTVKSEPIPVKQDINSIVKLFPNQQTDMDIATSIGTVFATGYDRVFEDSNHNVFLEIPADKIIRSMLHRYLDDINQSTDDQYRVCLKYRVNDKTQTIVRYQQTEFDDELFKLGYWYVSAFKVIPKNIQSE